MQNKFKTESECAVQSITPAGAWYLEKSLHYCKQVVHELSVHVALYINIHMLTDAPKEFHEQVYSEVQKPWRTM